MLILCPFVHYTLQLQASQTLLCLERVAQREPFNAVVPAMCSVLSNLLRFGMADPAAMVLECMIELTEGIPDFWRAPVGRHVTVA